MALRVRRSPRRRPYPVIRCGKSPFDIGTQTQLFLDQVLVRRTQGCAFTVYPAVKRPKNPLMRADSEWARLAHSDLRHRSVRRRPKDLQDVVHRESEGYFGDLINPTRYATSKDGIEWEKPLIGTLQSGKTGGLDAAGMSGPRDRAGREPSAEDSAVLLRTPRTVEDSLVAG